MTEAHDVPKAVLGHHLAILGKTGSGKTSTEKKGVEQVVADGFRVCVLDTIKSDWWGITSSASGKKPGLPFKILGGPHGHVPLHSGAGKAIGQLVGAGKLPLSIIDMADFEAGGLQRFFVDFAQALMRSATGVLYLVIEEAHELAPKERSGVGAENLSIHWAKKLATAGRSKGIRLIVATQRIQALHNAVLGSCETIIAHRLTTPADQEPVLKWLKANTAKETAERVAASLSSLPTGTAWVCSGEARIFEQMKFRKFETFDNTATPTGDGEAREVTMAPVDQAELRTIIGDAVQEAEANDPRILKQRIAELERRPAQATMDPQALESARYTGYLQGIAAGRRHIRNYFDHDFIKHVDAARAEIDRLTTMSENEAPPHQDGEALAKSIQLATKFTSAPGHQTIPSREPVARTKPMAAMRHTTDAAGLAKPPLPSANGQFDAPQRRVLEALAFWETKGHGEPERDQVAALAGYAAGSGNFNNILGRTKADGGIDYPQPGKVRLIISGITPPDAASAERRFWSVLNAPQTKVVRALLENAGRATRDTLARSSGYAPGSGNFNNILGGIRRIGIVDYPRQGEVEIASWVGALDLI